MSKLEELIAASKLNGLLDKKGEKKTNKLVVVLAIIGIIVVIAGVAYALYRFFKPADLDDVEFEDEFDEDFFEEDEVVDLTADEEDEIVVDDVFEEE